MYPSITESENIKVTEQYFTMSDGVRLYTRIAAPKGKAKLPIVWIRTPYEKAHNGVPHVIAGGEEELFVRNGYAVVTQHCRGRGDSEGVCIPYEEREDGLESLRMIRELDIYDHEIYLFGKSYLTTVHLCYLNTKPEDIKGAVLNIQTDRMYFRNYRNGCCYDYCYLKWWLSMINRAYPEQKLEGAVKRPYKDLMKRIIGEDFPPYTGMLLNHQYNDFWKDDPRTDVIESLDFPVLFAEGWYDYYIEGMFSMWERLPERTKQKSTFVVGPWGHDTKVTGSAEYDLKNGDLPADYAVRWFDSIRSGEAYPYAQVGQVNYHVIGGNCWENRVYPGADQEAMRLYFGEKRKLTSTPEVTEEEITYLYDPEKRVNCFPYKNIYRAAEPNSVDGVISFQTEAFTDERDFFGKIRWRMTVSSDCEDTAFFIRVYFVEENVAYNLTETITSLSHLTEDYRPGEKVIIDLFTPPISFRVKKGGKIRVDIASDGGIYVPHANKKEHWAEVTETVKANNTIYVRGAFIELHQSCVEHC